MGILEIASRKLEIPRNASCMTGHNTGQKWQGCKKSKRDQPRIQRRNIQKSFCFFFKLYIIVLVLPNIKMNPPQVYMCSPSWTLLPPHSIPLCRPSAPAPSIQYCTLNLDWQLVNCLDRHDGVARHLEVDILECEVKWALGSIIINKANGGDEIPAELFQILKDAAAKELH